jgi:PAS domain S-box-containing protein
MIGMKPSILNSGKQDDDFYLRMWDSLSKNNVWQGEIWNKHKDGKIYPEWLNISAVVDEQDNVTNYVGAFIDFTEQKKAEDALRVEHERAQGYLDTVETIIVALNEIGEIDTINRKGCQILGYEENDLIGLSWFETCLPQENIAPVSAHYLSVIAGNEHIVEYTEGAILTCRGETRLIAWHNAPLMGEDGKIFGVLSAGEDITEHRRLDIELKKFHSQAGKMVEQQVVSQTVLALAHELNQPLNAAGTYSTSAIRLLDVAELDTTRLKKVLAQNIQEIQRAGMVLKDMVKTMHPNDSASDRINLNDTILKAIRMFYDDPRKSSCVSYECDSVSAAIFVRSKHIVLEKILMNLLWNAYQSIMSLEQNEKDAQILICINRLVGNGTAVVSVIDSGPELSGEVLENLFTPLFTTKLTGLGMGLAISRSLIESCGGKLWYETVGGHSAFHFAVPVIGEK